MLDEDITRLLEARHHAPFEVLGPKYAGDRLRLRLLIPEAVRVRIEAGPPLLPVAPGLFEWSGPAAAVRRPGRIVWHDACGGEHHELDAYAFPGPLAAPVREQYPPRLHEICGAQSWSSQGVNGHLFTVWAPHAERVSVVGPFNSWDGRRHPMQVLGSSGLWRLFLPALTAGIPYAYEIRHRESGAVVIRADPFARALGRAPAPVSVTARPSCHRWEDADWISRRRSTDWATAPVSIYEVHLGSWRRNGSDVLGYREIAEPLAEHVAALGFTHVELLPVMEHPFGGSWGYQTLGYFAPTSRYGDADDLRWFVDRLHERGIGVIVDWTPAHFPRDAGGLAWFDGEPLYEYGEGWRSRHPDWDTAIFDYGRARVRDFLISSACFWLEEFHVDGVRVDAVASMLYLDYSRPAATWVPNRHGGRENLEAVGFLRQLNDTITARHPGALVIAEESTAWPGVTADTALGGLGFTFKWNMGWMHDTLTYLRLDPIYRSYHHHRLTFARMYAYSERFVLALSHDEVVHGKASLLHKMWGDDWQKFAQLRLLYCYQFTFPGKKLLFMGSEFGVRGEWCHDSELNWPLLDHAPHQGIANLVRDLNLLYREDRALHGDADPDGFEWIDCHDTQNSVLSYMRRCDGATLIVVLNFTPLVRHGYRIGVPDPGAYEEVVNSDSTHYGGSNVGNAGIVHSAPVPWMGHGCCLDLTLPPFGALLLRHRPGSPTTDRGRPPNVAG